MTYQFILYFHRVKYPLTKLCKGHQPGFISFRAFFLSVHSHWRFCVLLWFSNGQRHTHKMTWTFFFFLFFYLSVFVYRSHWTCPMLIFQFQRLYKWKGRFFNSLCFKNLSNEYYTNWASNLLAHPYKSKYKTTTNQIATLFLLGFISFVRIIQRQEYIFCAIVKTEIQGIFPSFFLYIYLLKKKKKE